MTPLAWTIIYVLGGLILGATLTWILFPRRLGRKPANERTAAEQVEFMRNLLAFLLVGSFVFSVPLFVFKDIPSGNQDIIVYMMGQLSGMALTSLGFYFVNKAGQDAVDAKRADNTGALAEVAKKALDQVNPQPLDERVIRDGDAVEVRKPPEGNDP